VVNVVGRLIDGVKAKGSATAIDVSDIAQRESFDVIGMVKPPCWHTTNMLSVLLQESSACCMHAHSTWQRYSGGVSLTGAHGA